MNARLALLVMLLLSVAPRAAARPDPAEQAYQEARRAYYALKDDPSRRKFRHQWRSAVARFEAVARSHPRSARAPDALFTAAELLRDLSQISRLDEDLTDSVAHYRKLLSAHPKHNLADDAALALARVQLERLEQPEAARATLEHALAKLPRGDRRGELNTLLAVLPAARASARETAVAEARPSAKGAEGTKAEKHAEPAKAAEKHTEPSKSPEKLAEGTKLAERHADAAKATEPARTAEKQAEPTRTAEKAADAAKRDAPVAEAPAKAAETAPLLAAIEKVGREAPAPALRTPVPARTAEAPARPELAARTDAAPATSDARTEPAPVEPAVVVSAPPTVSEQAGAAALNARLTALGVGRPGTSAAGPAAPARVSEPVQRERLKAAARQLGEAELTLAEQLGLKVRRVIIDAGHGGHDTGAIGKKGTREKDVALSIAQRLAAQLTARGLEVVLTRNDDRFVRLEDRARFANEHKGDLFISVHCNSAVNRKLRGIETYTLNTSADRYSIRLAARENASSEKSLSDLQFILADLATKANTEESSRLASRVQRSLVTSLSQRYGDIKDLGHKEALFYVLLGVRMPAILVETSFLSHPDEEKRLASGAYQEAVAQAIARGVDEFLGNRDKLAHVD